MRKFGRYTLSRRLGVGGMGEVWMGRREALGGAALNVAIKLLTGSRAGDPDARKMFLDEARLSMLLNNSNIVKVFDVDQTDDGTCYMVMEWVDGLDLSQLSAQLKAAGERLPDPMIAYIVGEVLKGLAHAHELTHRGVTKTIVHRDISPHNVMISVFGEVKIMDFGIARMASEDTSGTHVRGKLRYMPPEQLRGETREPTLDLFSLGAMLHELLDGRQFRGKVIDESRLFGMILDGEIPPLDRNRASFPHELEALRIGLLATAPRDRIQSARKAFRLLTRWTGYRDMRFELDDLVRRFVNKNRNDEPGPDLGPGAMVIPEGPSASDAFPTMVVSTASRSRPIRPPAPKPKPEQIPRPPLFPSVPDDEATLILPDGSDTDLTLRRKLAPPAHSLETTALSHLASTSHAGGGLLHRRLPAILIGVGIVLGLGVAGSLALDLGSKDEPTAEVELPGANTDENPEPDLQASAVRDDNPVPEPELILGPEPELILDPEPELILDPEPELALDPEPELALDPEPELALDPEPAPAEPKIPNTKVSITLGAGVPWAEVKIGRRSFELDAFSSKTSTTWFPVGGYSASYRTKVGGPWKKTNRVTIPEAKTASVTLKKGGSLAVE